ncbi:MAG: ATP-binding cassette domain-containing protein, partial [bacterium]|nr:ATP-binding cassette domain-containing protein [bacterium]
MYYDDILILDNLSFVIEKKEKVALLGANGSGKTTLLKILVGHLEAEAGEVSLSGGARVHYLAQDPKFPPHSTLYDAVAQI